VDDRLIAVLLEYGADPAAKNKKGLTPLDVATQKKKRKAEAALREAGEAE